jgi:hypothetical protein
MVRSTILPGLNAQRRRDQYLVPELTPNLTLPQHIVTEASQTTIGAMASIHRNQM